MAQQNKELSYKDIHRVLSSNGWIINLNDNGDYHFYEMKLVSYDWIVLVQAWVSEHEAGYEAAKDYGVGLLMARDSEYEEPFLCSRGLHKLLHAIDLAEANLLTVGVPFEADYKFHGKNVANKKRRNAALRRKFNLPEEA